MLSSFGYRPNFSINTKDEARCKAPMAKYPRVSASAQSRGNQIYSIHYSTAVF